MTRIGLLSDTHGYFHPSVRTFFENCDEIWHAGDAGDHSVLDELGAMKPLRAVYGNIDGQDVRSSHPLYQSFLIEKLNVLMIHIGGYPKRYNPYALNLIREHRPGLFISGHSHILKVIYDPEYDLLHINPGAAGKYGLHNKITMVRFVVDNKKVQDLEIYETEK